MNTQAFYDFGTKNYLKNLNFRISWSNQTPVNDVLENVRFSLDYFLNNSASSTYTIFTMAGGKIDWNIGNKAVINEANWNFNNGFVDFTVNSNKVSINSQLKSLFFTLNSKPYNPSNRQPLQNAKATGHLSVYQKTTEALELVKESGTRQVIYVAHYDANVVKLNILPEKILINLSYNAS